MTDEELKRKELKKKAYVALLKVSSEIYSPFLEYTEDYPDVGDVVSPGKFNEKFTFKIDKTPDVGKLSLDEIKSTTWYCSGILDTQYTRTYSMTSVDKIRGKVRTIKYRCGWGSVEFEIASVPEKAKLIKQYRGGKLTLLELLRVFKEKGYHTNLQLKSIFIWINGNDYLEAMEEIEKENQNQN